MTDPPNPDPATPGAERAANARESPAAEAGRGRAANRLRWLGAAALAFLLVTLVALLFRDRIAAAVLPGILGHALGLRVSIDSVSISLRGAVVVRGITGDSPAADSAVRGLRVGELRATASLLDIPSRGILAIESIAVTDARVEIDVDRLGGGASGESERASGVAPFPWPSLPPEIAVRGDVVLVSRDARLELSDLELRATAGGDLAATAMAAWRLGRRSGAAPAALRLAYAAGTFSDARLVYGGDTLLDAARFDARSLSGEATAHVSGGSARITVSNAATGVLRASVSATGLRLEDALALALRVESPVSGSADLEAVASVPLVEPLAFSAEASARCRDGAVAGVDVAEADVVARVDRGEALVSRFRASGPFGEVEARDGRVSFDAGLDPRALLASATGRVSVSLADAALVDRLAVVPDEVRELLEGARIDADLALESGVVRVRSLDAVSERLGTSVSLDAATLEPALDSPRDTRFFAIGRVAAGDLAKFSGFLPEAARPAGAVDVEFALVGTIGSPHVRAALRGSGLGAAGVAGVAIDAVALATADSLHVARLDAASAEGAVSLAFAADRGGVGQEPFVAFADADVSVAGKGRFALPFSSARLRASATGPLAWPDVSASLEADGLGTAAIEKTGDAIVARVTRLTAPGVTLDFDAEGSVARDLSSGDVAISRFRAVAGDDAWDQEGDARLSFDFPRRRYLLDPALAVRSGAESIRLSVSSRDDLLAARASVRLSGEGGAADLVRRALPEADVSFSRLRFDMDAASPLSATGGAGLPESVAATLSVDRIDAWGSSGAVDAILRVATPPGAGAPSATLDAALRGFRSDLAAGFGPPPGHASVNVAWDGENLRVDGGSIDWSGLVASLSGSARFTLEDARALVSGGGGVASGPESLDLHLDGRIDDLSSLRNLVPALRRFSGSSVVALRVSGSAVAPRVEGTVDVADLDTRIGDLPPLVGLRGRVVLDGDAAVVEKLEGEMGGSPFTVAGGVTSLFGEPRLDFVLSGEDLLLVREDDARIRGTTRISVTGPLSRLAIAGDIRLTDARVRRDVAILDVGGLVRKSVRRVREVGARPSVGAAGGIRLFSIHEPPLRDVRLDVRVSADQPIDLLGNVFSGKVRPDVRLRGTGEVPFLTGVVYVEEFLLRLPVARIRVESGILRFDEKNPYFPEIEMTGSTRLRGYDIDVSISGPYDDPLLVLSSNPPMASDQLMVLVATGRTPSDEASRSDTAVLIGVASYIGGDLLTSLFGGGGVDDDEESLLDRFELEMGRNVSRSGQETIEARFRLKRGALAANDTLYLTGERDEFEHYNAGLRIVFRGK